MDENEFEMNGKTYVSQAQTTCIGCAFKFPSNDCFEAPECASGFRVDSTSVIFVEKQQ